MNLLLLRDGKIFPGSMMSESVYGHNGCCNGQGHGIVGPAPRIDPPVAIDNPDAALESQDRVYRRWS